jgi:hypothetical protein
VTFSTTATATVLTSRNFKIDEQQVEHLPLISIGPFLIFHSPFDPRRIKQTARASTELLLLLLLLRRRRPLPLRDDDDTCTCRVNR